MDFYCTVVGPRAGSGARRDPYRPQFIDHYPHCSYTMVGDSGDPMTIDAYIPDDVTAAQLEIDTRYTVTDWTQASGGSQS